MSLGVDEESEERAEPESDRWVKVAVSSLGLAGRVSTALFVGAAIAVALGVFAAVATYVAASDTPEFGEGLTMPSQDWATAAQVASILLSCLLPAGLLAAAGAAIRLQAARFETDILAD